MALFLVQHGRSLPKDIDPDQGLSPEGMEEVEKIAQAAKGYGVKVTRIIHSGKKRALQTADIFASYLEPESGVLEKGGLKPMDDVSDWADRVKTDDNLMLVGHLPFMEKLTSLLIAGYTDTTVFKFQNGGIVCLDAVPDSESWFIKWALVPNIS